MNEFKNPFNQALTGQEIKDWVWYNSQHKTANSSLAKRMSSFFNLDNNKIYMTVPCNNAPVAIEVPERGVKYEIPCDD